MPAPAQHRTPADTAPRPDTPDGKPPSGSPCRCPPVVVEKPVIIPYQFTLAELNRRSYYLIHGDDGTGASAASTSSRSSSASSRSSSPSLPPDTAAATTTTTASTASSASLPTALAPFRTHLRRAVVLANLEAVIVRNAQIAGKPPGSVLLHLANPADGSLAQRSAVLAENAEALAPVEVLLRRENWTCGLAEVGKMLKGELREAKAALEAARRAGWGGAEGACPGGLRDLAFTFAAYQPAVLDELVKGSQSPCDPRSRTPTIKRVQELVKGSLAEAGAKAPHRLAKLAMRLLRAVPPGLQAYTLALDLLQAGCMSGHVELVERLLGPEGVVMFELDMIRRLRTAWVGYKGYKPLQEWRSSNHPHAHTIDWLDFKCSAARAVLIGHTIVETLILRDDHNMTLSLRRPATTRVAGGGAPGSASRPCTPGPPPTLLQPPPRPSSASGGPGEALLVAADCSSAPPPPPPPTSAAAVAEADEAGSQVADRVHFADGTTDRLAWSAAAAAAATTANARVLPRVSTSLQRELLIDDEHAELEPKKWRIVTDLFRRPAACRALAIAMMHVIRSGKHDVQQVLRKEREERAAAAAAAAAAAPATATAAAAAARGGGGGGEGGEEGDAEDAVLAGEAERLAAKEEEAREAVKYRKLHRLAVQACHLAVHSTSLSAVSDAILCVRSVRAWPAIELPMLNDLAAHFPRQCAALLEAIPLQDVDLEDNVLPFGLPPGFATVAVSDKDAAQFCAGGGGGSTQDAEHFATQREEDDSIEASLLVQGRTWAALLFLFWPSEFASPTTRKLLRVLGCAAAAFACQGPGSCAVALAFGAALAVVGAASRLVVALVRIVYWSVFHRLWLWALQRFPVLGRLANRIRDREVPAAAAAGGGGGGGGAAAAQVPLSPVTPHGGGGAAASWHWHFAGKGGGGAVPGGGGGGDDDGRDSDDEGLPVQLGRGLWRGFLAHGHNAVIDAAVGWGKGSASISCRKVPMPLSYGGYGRRQQLDTALLEKLLGAPGVHPSVFGSKVLKAFILFKWNYFTKYFIILQLLLHVTYMAVFTAYAFTIKDMLPVDGREHGPGARVEGCQLQAPSRVQAGLLAALAVMTVDFVIQEVRQIRHFGLRFLAHTWDLLDVASVSLVVASITLHFTCSSGASPLTLRGLAAVQIVLLFMRLLYYAMASDKLGSFVRMVLETTYDLMMFFAFLSVVFVGFALAIIIAQGALADEEQTFIKMFTMMYGDFDVTFLSTLDSGALGLDALTRVIASVYMILVTIILLNLLISIISESYERIRENERWESLRNKALLIVESETQLYQFFLNWLYATLTPASAGEAAGPDGREGRDCKDTGRRFLYVIVPEYARRVTSADDDDEEEDDDDDGNDDDDDDGGADGQWNGRLGEMKRHITTQARATMDTLRREVHKVLESLKDLRPSNKADAGGAVAAASAAEAVDTTAAAAAPEGAAAAISEAGRGAAAAAAAPGGSSGSPVSLDLDSLAHLSDMVGERLGRQISALRGELMAELARAVAVAAPPHPLHPHAHPPALHAQGQHPQQVPQPQQHPGGSSGGGGVGGGGGGGGGLAAYPSMSLARLAPLAPVPGSPTQPALRPGFAHGGAARGAAAAVPAVPAAAPPEAGVATAGGAAADLE